MGEIGRSQTAPTGPPDTGDERYPTSPPPPYEEIAGSFPRPPPTYDEATTTAYTYHQGQDRRHG